MTNPTPPDFERELEAAFQALGDYHGCLTGDCPHDHFDGCLAVLHAQGARWALTSEVVTRMASLLERAKPLLEEYFEGLPEEIGNALAAYNSATANKQK